MKSINVKRIAAVAAGVAMVGSVMASGLAVTESTGVSTLVDSIKANLDNTQVVLGTNAELSDGIQAAKIAATLASVNYAAVSGQTLVVTDKNVVLETGAGTTEAITTARYPAGLAATSAGTSGHWDSIHGANATITRTMMPDVLSQKTLQATVNGTSTQYLYEDSIVLSGLYSKYDEANSLAYSGHGLYLSGSYASGSLVYKLEFAGSGLPVGTGRTYTAIPEIDMLGHTIGIDYSTATDAQLTIYSGTKSTMMTGDEVSTTEGYKVHLDSVTQGSGTTYYAIYTATSPTGTTETSTQLTTSGSYNFFANKISVYCDYVGYDQSAAKGTTISRVTGGKKYLQDNTEFPLDKSWTVQTVQQTGGNAVGYLNYITLKYGAATNPPQWTGSVQTGLAQGTVIDGPKMADGTPKFQMKLKGFGSTSTIIDTTPVSIQAVGSSESGIPSTHLLKPTWIARDGSTQTLDAQLPYEVAIPATGASSVSLNTGLARYTIINDKVVYLSAVTPTTEAGKFTITFKIGGLTGTDVTIGPINATGGNATFSYTTNVNPISCDVVLGNIPNVDGIAHSDNVTIIASGTAMNIGDTGTGCDIIPNIVPFGVSTSINPAAAPYLDLRFIQGNATGDPTGTYLNNPNANKVIFNSTSTNKYWPVLKVVGPSGTDNVTVVYDSEIGTDQLSGILAYGNLESVPHTNVTANSTLFGPSACNSSSDALLINQAVASSGATESTKYDVDPWSTELDGSAARTLSIVMPEAQRSAIFEISKTIGNGTSTTGTVTATEGQSVGNVKVMSIGGTCPVSGTNLFSPTKVVAPESLVVLDSEASATYQIVVGGPWVNSVAQTVSGNEATTTAAGASVLIADGTKLLVAGYLATDTASAADALVNKLKA
jgi:hypothetical protein